MSSFIKKAKHPETGEVEPAFFIDDYYGKHEYGVKFKDGQVYPIARIVSVEGVCEGLTPKDFGGWE